MLKGIGTFVVSALIAGHAFAGANPMDCQTSSTFEQNLDEINEVTNKVSNDECPKPTADQFKGVCESVYKKKPSKIPELNYSYHEELWNISCAKPGVDSIETAKLKVQTMWNKYREDFRCYNYPTSIATDKNITKFSMDMHLSVFLLEAVKRYKLDMNFKDPADQKTILDFLQERKEYILSNPPVDQVKAAEYEKIYTVLKTNGAKHAKDL